MVDTSTLIKGIDVSVIQDNIDWQAVAAADIKFCIARCAVGNSNIDTNYIKNRDGAKAAGIKFMAYNFIYPLPPLSSQPMRDPVRQANYHFNATQGELSAIDCEWPAPQDWAKWNCSSSQINDWMIAYFNEYTRLDNGRKPVLYLYPYWASAVKLDPQFAQYPLWIASYQASPAIPHPWNDWTLWQNSGGTQRLPNSNVPVDTDYAKDLSLWDSPQIVVLPASPDTAITTPPVVTVPPVQPAPTPTDPVSNFFNNIVDTIGKFIKK